MVELLEVQVVAVEFLEKMVELLEKTELLVVLLEIEPEPLLIEYLFDPQIEGLAPVEGCRETEYEGCRETVYLPAEEDFRVTSLTLAGRDTTSCDSRSKSSSFVAIGSIAVCDAARLAST